MSNGGSQNELEKRKGVPEMHLDSYSKWKRFSWNMDDHIRRMGLRHLKGISSAKELRELFADPHRFGEALLGDGFEFVHEEPPVMKLVGKGGSAFLKKIDSGKPPLPEEEGLLPAPDIGVEFYFTGAGGRDGKHKPRMIARVGKAEPEILCALVDILITSGLSFIVVQDENRYDDLLTLSWEMEEEAPRGFPLTRVDFYELNTVSSYFYHGFTVEMLIEILADTPVKIADGEYANAIRDYLYMREIDILSALEPAINPVHYSMITDDANVEKIRARLALETILGDNFKTGLKWLTIRGTDLYDSTRKRESACRVMFTQEEDRVREIEVWRNQNDNH